MAPLPSVEQLVHTRVLCRVARLDASTEGLAWRPCTGSGYATCSGRPTGEAPGAGHLRTKVGRRTLPGASGGSDGTRRVDRSGSCQGSVARLCRTLDLRAGAGLRARTVELYRWLLRKHIAPRLGGVPLGKLGTASIPEWRSELLDNGVSATMTAKAYRLLRAILMTAVGEEDTILPRNPCRVPGADKENPEERPTLTLSQVFALADTVPRTYRALVLLTTFASLRYGEVTALQRGDLDTEVGTVRVRQVFTEVRGSGMVLGPPKSRAVVRTIAIPVPILPTLRHHLATYVDEGPAAFVFTGPNGAVIRRGNFNKVAKWTKTVAELGVPGLHFHDLRHTGNTSRRQTRVGTLRDLMARMGHDSMRAAIIYQHAPVRPTAPSRRRSAARSTRSSERRGED